MMKGILSHLKKDKKSKSSGVDKNGSPNKKGYDYCISGVILGQSESGKTTLQRQLELLYGLETYDPKYYQRLIYGNTLATLIRLIENTEKLNLTLMGNDSQERVKRVVSTPVELARNKLPRFPLKLSYDCKCLWEDKAIQMVYNHSKFCSDFRTPGRVKYYMDNMFRVFSPDFIPSEMDVISAYDQVEKSQVSTVLHRRLKMELVCCPGKLSNPKEWDSLYALHHPHYIFYVVSLKDYNIDNINSCSNSCINGIEIPEASKQICSHHTHRNQLIDSLASFESLTNSELFDKAYSVILVFNVSEIFDETIKLFDLKISFPDYTGPDGDSSEAMTYIINRFTKLLKEKNKPYNSHVVNLLEKQNVKDQVELMMDYLIPDAENKNLVHDITSLTTTTIDISAQPVNALTLSNGNGNGKNGRNRGHSDSSNLSSSSGSNYGHHPSSILPNSSIAHSVGSTHSNTNAMIQSLNDNDDVDDNASTSSSTTTTTTTTTTASSSTSKSKSKKESKQEKEERKERERQEKLERKQEKLEKQSVTKSIIAAKKKTKGGLQGVVSGYHGMQGRRKNMEDAHSLYDNLLETLNHPARTETPVCRYYAVYDGHGGTETSMALEPIVHKCIVDTEAFRAGDYPLALKEGYDAADKMVIPVCEKSGSTGVSCMIVGSTLYVANIGDSEAVLGRFTATSSSKNPVYEHQLLTYKHTANDEKEKARITEMGGMIIFGRLFGSLAVARSFGDKGYKEGDKKFVSNEPYQMTIDLTPKDQFIILACDGLWDQVSYDEAVQFVAKSLKLGKTPSEISADLAQDSWEKGSVDNITVLVIVFNWK